jgi:hypothetical protein
VPGLSAAKIRRIRLWGLILDPDILRPMMVRLWSSVPIG